MRHGHYMHSRKYISGEIKGRILLDLSKAFGGINRNKLWYSLYEFGLTKNLTRAIINCHLDAQLCAKHLNNRCPLIPNNIGGFRGSPLSAQLFIIYAEHAMINYNAIIDTNLINLNE